MTDAPTLAYFGHHKCGSTMILRIVNKVCRYLGMNHAHFHSPKEWSVRAEVASLDHAVDHLELDFVSYISADIRYIADKRRYKALHVIRDPRDIVVSSYFSHRFSHSTDHWPELIEFRRTLEELSQEEGLLENMKFTARLPVDGMDLNLFATLLEWDYSMPNVLEIKFEDLAANPYQVLVEMFEFLGLIDDELSAGSGFRSLSRHILQNRFPRLQSFRKLDRMPAWLLFSFIYSNRFAKLAGGRDQGKEDVHSHYRKGVPGDWRNHFTARHKDYFKKNHNDLLVRLGYEKDDTW